MRHRRNLPVRGQRTHTNARTRKGPRKGMAIKKIGAGRAVERQQGKAQWRRCYRNKPKAKQKKKVRKNIQTGVAHISATFNNTIVSITDVSGNVVAWSCAGTCGLQGLAQVDAVRRAARRRGRRQEGDGARRAQRDRLRQRSGLGT